MRHAVCGHAPSERATPLIALVTKGKGRAKTTVHRLVAMGLRVTDGCLSCRPPRLREFMGPPTSAGTTSHHPGSHAWHVEPTTSARHAARADKVRHRKAAIANAKALGLKLPTTPRAPWSLHTPRRAARPKVATLLRRANA